MNSKTLHYSRKLRHFRYRTKQLNRMIQTDSLHTVSAGKLQRLIRQVKDLYQELKWAVGTGRLRRMLAGAAILIGLSAGTQAQTFADPVSNPFGLSGVGNQAFPELVDIDSDGDLDLFISDYNDTLYFNLRFYENTGDAENPSFGSVVDYPFGITDENLTRPTFADLDNDGDLDMLAGIWLTGSGDLLYYENTGSSTAPAFAEPITNPFNLTSGSYIAFAELIDIDNDGDTDLMITDYYGAFQYYENTGSPEMPAFAAPVTDPFNLAPPSIGLLRVFDFVDFDKDGDLDLFSQVYSIFANDNKLYYAENTGTAEAPAFANAQADPFGLALGTFYSSAPVGSDIDFDGDVDLIIGQAINGIVFYENTSNIRPVSNDTTLVTNQNTAYTFAATDFPYSDDNGDAFGGIRVMSLPMAGELTLDGTPVMVGQDVLASDIGQLVFTPATDESGPAYATFDFRIWDGMAMSADAYTVTFDVISGIADPLQLVEWTLSPNPTTDWLNFEAQLPANALDVRWSLIDQQGRLVRMQQLTNTGAELNVQIDVRSLTSGMYYLHLLADGKQLSIPFIKE
jgi:hypothetical protein